MRGLRGQIDKLKTNSSQIDSLIYFTVNMTMLLFLLFIHNFFLLRYSEEEEEGEKKRNWIM